MLLHLIENPQELEAAQRQLESSLRDQLPPLGEHVVTYKSGSKQVELFGEGEGRLYFGSRTTRGGSKFWNVFGIFKAPPSPQDIVVQINLNLGRGWTGGFVARDDAGKLYLLHSGGIGGGVEGIGKNAFLSWLGQTLAEAARTSGKPRDGIVIAELGAADLATRIETFVKHVYRFKDEVKSRAKAGQA